MYLLPVRGQKALAPLIIAECTNGHPIAGTVEFQQVFYPNNAGSEFVLTLRLRDERFVDAELGQFLLTYTPTEAAVPAEVDESHIIRGEN